MQENNSGFFSEHGVFTQCRHDRHHDVESWHPVAEQEVPDVDAAVHLSDVHDGRPRGAPVRVGRVLHHRPASIRHIEHT